MSKPKIHVDIDATLKKKLKIIAAQRGLKITDIISNLVAEYVNKNKS